MNHETNSQPTWKNQLRRARQLPTVELRRHAAVSRENRHRCQDCFCCCGMGRAWGTGG